MKLSNAFEDRIVCVLGLGYVGLTLAAVMADLGFKILGIETRADVLALLERGEPHFHEPGLRELLRRAIAQGRLDCYKHIPDDCPATVYIITVGTPLDGVGKARMDMIERVMREVGRHVKDGDLVVMRSTVKLGTTSNVALPILEATGKRVQLAFCPERTIEGQALSELRQLPQVVGASSFEAAIRASQIFQFLTPTIIRVTDIETAEMIKHVDNVQRDVTFAFSNEIAAMCDAGGISAMEVISAGRHGYSRTNLPIPGPVGGPCLSKDPYIFAEGLAEIGAVPELTLAARRTNEAQPEQVVSFVHGLTAKWPGFPDRPVISLLGIAFKGCPPTDDLRGTMARPVLESLRRHFPGAHFRGYDAVAADGIAEFGLEPCPDLALALQGAHLAFILNNHPIFAQMPIEDPATGMACPGLIYDFWNNFQAESLQLPAGIGYMALGSHGRASLPQAGSG